MIFHLNEQHDCLETVNRLSAYLRYKCQKSSAFACNAAAMAAVGVQAGQSDWHIYAKEVEFAIWHRTHHFDKISIILQMPLLFSVYCM